VSDLIENAFVFEVEEGDFFNIGRKIPNVQSSMNVDFDIDFVTANQIII
jgi:hypothetical protein